MRFSCESCHAQYFISDEKVGPNGVVARCKRCHSRIELRLRRSEDDLGRDVDAALAVATDLSPDRASTRVMSLVQMAGLTQAEPPREEKPEDAEPACGFSAADVEWFVALGERQTGPLSVAAIARLRARGEISGDSLCWRAGMGDWAPISEVPRLAEEIGLPAPEKTEPAGAVAMGAQAVVLPPPPLPSVIEDLVRRELEALDARAVEEPEPVAEPVERAQEILPPIAPPEPIAPAPAPTPVRREPVSAPAPKSDLILAIGIPVIALAIAILMVGIAILARSSNAIVPPPVAVAPPAPRHEETAAPPPPVVLPPPPAPVLEKEQEKVEAKSAVAPPVVARKISNPFKTPPPVATKVAKVDTTDADSRGVLNKPVARTRVDTSEIMEVLVAHRADIKKCTDAASVPEERNTIVMRWSIRPDGSVSNLQTATQEFRNTPLSQCLVAALSKLRFPEYSGPQMEPTEVPLRF